MSTPQVKFPCPVRRLRVRWKDGAFSLVKEVRIPSMTLPRSAKLPRVEPGEGVTGFWCELRDADGNLIYRRIIENPVQDVEIFDEGGEIRREPAAAREVIFDVLVPDLAQATQVRLVSDEAPGPEGGRLARAEVVAEIPLATPPRPKPPGRPGNDRG